jgi:hypothetical protein
MGGTAYKPRSRIVHAFVEHLDLAELGFFSQKPQTRAHHLVIRTGLGGLDKGLPGFWVIGIMAFWANGYF